jgi:cysteine desulfurase family protein (TIGR01976 family)
MEAHGEGMSRKPDGSATGTARGPARTAPLRPDALAPTQVRKRRGGEVNFPIDQVRAEFPALHVADGGRARIYFDAPGGTQACRPAIEAMAGHLEGGTANAGGAFTTSAETDAMSAAAHEAMADLLGGESGEIAFGPNMTSLTLAVSRSLARDWQAGDEIVLTRLDHDANVWPWKMAAEDRGATVRWLDFDPASGRLRLEELPALIGKRTRLVAVGGASNALGTLNDVATIAGIVRAGSDALLFVDAVQSVPHVPIDVAALGCDLLTCSPYKFFGPHQGVLWGRTEALAKLTAYKVRPASTEPPAIRFETGTPSFEGQAGVLGTINYLEWLGRTLAPQPPRNRREALTAAMTGCVGYERVLGERLLAGFAAIDGLRLYGPASMDGRVPTFAFTMDGLRPDAIAAALAQEGINAWSGHFYAIEPVRRLGLWESGGLVRVGLCHYSTMEEVDRLLEVLTRLRCD